MTLPLYLDHNVHGAIIAGLRRRGIDCLTAQEDGMAQAGDPAVLERASKLQRVLFTHDDDLLVIACDWQRAGRDFSGVIYGRQLGITIGRAINEIELLLTVLSAEEMRNQVQYLPL